MNQVLEKWRLTHHGRAELNVSLLSDWIAILLEANVTGVQWLSEEVSNMHRIDGEQNPGQASVKMEDTGYRFVSLLSSDQSNKTSIFR